MSLFFIRIKSITNKMLIADGWRVGMFVIDAEDTYGSTFNPQSDVVSGYESRVKAYFLASSIGNRHVGIEYEVVEYKPSA
jgi:hypothetical protein